MKLFDSERRVMEWLWREGELSAKELAARLGEEVGWNKNTTYTVIKKCVAKGAVQRSEPGFICRALITREAAQAEELNELVDKWFDGSESRLFAALLEGKALPENLADALRKLVDEEG